MAKVEVLLGDRQEFLTFGIEHQHNPRRRSKWQGQARFQIRLGRLRSH